MHKNAQKINVNGHTQSIRYYKSLYNENTKEANIKRYSAEYLKNLCILSENSAGRLRSRR